MYFWQQCIALLQTFVLSVTVHCSPFSEKFLRCFENDLLKNQLQLQTRRIRKFEKYSLHQTKLFALFSRVFVDGVRTAVDSQHM